MTATDAHSHESVHGGLHTDWAEHDKWPAHRHDGNGQTEWQTMGGRIRVARLAAGLTLDALAKASGVAKSYLSDLENGKLSNPTADTVRAVASAVHVNPGWITDGGPQLNLEAVAALGPRTFDLGARYLLDIAGEFAEEADTDLADHNPNLPYDGARLQLAQVWATAGLAAEVHETGERVGDLLEEVIARLAEAAPEPAVPEPGGLDKLIAECRRHPESGYRRGLAYAITALGGKVPLDHLTTE